MTQTPANLNRPKKAFVLAAGFGTRMRPLTDNCPKPLLYVDGITMLDRALDALVAAGVEEVVVNTHYLGNMIKDHLQNRTAPKITLSHEDQILDTGGGVKNVIDFFGDEPFYVLNADVVWVDGAEPTLDRLAKSWNSNDMDLLLLMEPLANQPNFDHGDYYLEGEVGKPVFSKNTDEAHKANMIFAGPRIVHPRLFKDAPEGAFSFLQLFHKAEKQSRLYGLRHDGEWHHVGTPDALDKTNAHFKAKGNNKKRAP